MRNPPAPRKKKRPSKLRLRQKAGIALLRNAQSGRQVLLVQQTDGQWSLPKGRRRLGETAKEACLRECHEETGYEPKEIHFVSCGMNSHKTVLLHLWKSEVFPPYPKNSRVCGRQKEVRQSAWFNPPQARKILKRWQWTLLAKVFPAKRR
jgi:8-oxo-dGTP pyrophosphatase MutT (NUDIX family)